MSEEPQTPTAEPTVAASSEPTASAPHEIFLAAVATDRVGGERPTPPPAATDHSLRDFVVNLLTVAGLAAAVAVGVNLVMAPSTPAGGDRRIVQVDTERLAREEIDALGDLVAQRKLPSEEMPVRSRAFSEGLLREIATYADQGTLVLRSAAVLAAPADIPDVTEAVRQRLLAQGIMARKPEPTEIARPKP